MPGCRRLFVQSEQSRIAEPETALPNVTTHSNDNTRNTPDSWKLTHQSQCRGVSPNAGSYCRLRRCRIPERPPLLAPPLGYPPAERQRSDWSTAWKLCRATFFCDSTIVRMLFESLSNSPLNGRNTRRPANNIRPHSGPLRILHGFL